jgi:hypothetical protein
MTRYCQSKSSENNSARVEKAEQITPVVITAINQRMSAVLVGYLQIPTLKAL